MTDRPVTTYFPGPPIKATYEQEYEVRGGATDADITQIELPARLPHGKVRVRIEIERLDEDGSS